MPNWCSNTVVFVGNADAIKQIQQLFKTMAEKEKEERMGQLPDFVSNIHGGYFFELYWEKDDIGVFRYETKWSPNIEIVRDIAKHYKVSFTLDYEEMGNMVYGRATYAKRKLTDIYLDDEDFEAYRYDEETDTYHFEGQTYESDVEILETLLERKIKNLTL